MQNEFVVKKEMIASYSVYSLLSHIQVIFTCILGGFLEETACDPGQVEFSPGRQIWGSRCAEYAEVQRVGEEETSQQAFVSDWKSLPVKGCCKG